MRCGASSPAFWYRMVFLLFMSEFISHGMIDLFTSFVSLMPLLLLSSLSDLFFASFACFTASTPIRHSFSKTSLRNGKPVPGLICACAGQLKVSHE